MKMGGFFIGAEAALLNAATLGCERYGLSSTGDRSKS
jgi:hypothetical protein